MVTFIQAENFSLFDLLEFLTAFTTVCVGRVREGDGGEGCMQMNVRFRGGEKAEAAERWSCMQVFFVCLFVFS